MYFSDFRKIIGLFYIILIIIFFFVIFFSDLKYYFSLEYIQNNRDELLLFKADYVLEISLAFFAFTVLWSFLLGFGTPLLIIAGFFFDLFYGLSLLLIAKTIGATLMYIIAKFFFKEKIQFYLKSKHEKTRYFFEKIKKSELTSLLLFRLIPGLPVQVADLAPILIDAKIINYILGKFIGSILPNLILLNIVHNFFKFYEKENELNLNLFESKEFLLSILFFFVFLLISYFIKNKFFNK